MASALFAAGVSSVFGGPLAGHSVKMDYFHFFCRPYWSSTSFGTQQWSFCYRRCSSCCSKLFFNTCTW